jgi:hypothetical protein
MFVGRGGADHGVDASLVTGFDEELDVCVHEGDCHCDITAIRKHKFFMIAEFLDETENIVLEVNRKQFSDHPSTTVQP